MRREIAEIPAAAARLAEPAPQAEMAAAGAALRALDPMAVMTFARGSSDHAASVLAHAIGVLAGRPVASVAPSLASVFGARLAGRGLAGIAISQSGASPDLRAALAAARAGGAETLVLTNTPESPLAAAAGRVVDVAAGPERAVAATKSFVNSVLAGLWVLAYWREDADLRARLAAAPERLAAALAVESAALAGALAGCTRLAVLGRGPTLGIAREVALKAMELCGIPALAYSGAEVLHGPATVLADGFPFLCVGAPEAAGLEAACARLEGQGARRLAVPLTADGEAGDFVAGLAALVPIYAALEAAARSKGRDPDRPAFLRKETVTR